MAPSWYPAVIAVTLYDVRDRPAIDLEMESQIPYPKFGTLSTIRRPGRGLPCATVLMEIAHRKARIRRTLLTKLCLGFMAHITHTTGFSPVLWPKPKPKHTGESRCVQTGERENALSAYERAKPSNIVISGIFSAYFCPLLLIWAGNAEEPSHHHGGWGFS